MNAMKTVDLLVKAEFLYPVSEGMPIIYDGEVAVVGSRIVYVGPAMPADHWAPKNTLGGPGKIVMPGFVNCHSHAASLIFRSQTDDHSAKAALLDVAFRMEKDITEADWSLLGALGCADMLLSGITTINDIWYSPDTLIESVLQSGLRAQIANKVFDVKLEELRHGDYTHHPSIGEARLRHGVEFVEKWHGAADGRISGRIGTHATDTCSPALLKEARHEANRLGVGMHIHAAQSAAETDHIRNVYGCGPVEYLRDIGMLSSDVVLAHLVFAKEADFNAMVSCNASYAHCPTIYPRRGRYPEFEKIIAKEIKTGFATDWMLNDPFEGMRYAINAMRLRLGTPTAMTCDQALRFHTMGAAEVLGLEKDIGSLEVGKKADMIVIDIDQPHLQPYYGSYAAFVYYARASDVTDSVIDGKVVMRERQLSGLDHKATFEKLQKRLPPWRSQLSALGSPAVFGPSCDCCGLI
jgi:5-methylthioadenosine/S-adenosylhomocysteine deaminase